MGQLAGGIISFQLGGTEVSGRVKCYLAGLCHGVAAVWVVGYALFKTGTPLAALFDPSDGAAPIVLALPVMIAGSLFLMYSGKRRGPEPPKGTGSGGS